MGPNVLAGGGHPAATAAVRRRTTQAAAGASVGSVWESGRVLNLAPPALKYRLQLQTARFRADSPRGILRASTGLQTYTLPNKSPRCTRVEVQFGASVCRSTWRCRDLATRPAEAGAAGGGGGGGGTLAWQFEVAGGPAAGARPRPPPPPSMRPSMVAALAARSSAATRTLVWPVVAALLIGGGATTSDPLTILTTSCPSGAQYRKYAGCRIEVSGGAKPYKFETPTGAAGFRDRRRCDSASVCSGMGHGGMPEGLELDGATGVVSSPGTVGGMGTYAPHIIVTDARGAVAQTDGILFAIAGDSTLAGCAFFPHDSSIFHAKVTDLPVDTSPAAPIAPQYSRGRIHALFGSNNKAEPRRRTVSPHTFGPYFPFGMPFLRVPHNTANQSVSKSIASGSAEDFTSGPFPLDAPTEGGANDGYGKLGGDRHLLIVEEVGGGEPCKLWEMYQGRRIDPATNTTWTASAMALWPNLSSNQLRPNGLGSTDGCGLPVAPLLANFDEVCGPGRDGRCTPGVIRHPIRFTVNHMLAAWVWPARVHSGIGSCKWGNGSIARHQLPQGADGPASCGMSGPCGQIYRLKKGIASPAGCEHECKVLVQGFRDYGIILADNGEAGGVCGTPDPRWNDTSLSMLTKLTLDDFEPVDVSGLIVDNDSGETSRCRLKTEEGFDGSKSKSPLIRLASGALAAPAATNAVRAPVTVHVSSSSGSDTTGDGSHARPLASPTRAATAVRGRPGSTVLLQPGFYGLPRLPNGSVVPPRFSPAALAGEGMPVLDLYADDSGAAGAPITYSAVAGAAAGSVLLSAGARVQSSAPEAATCAHPLLPAASVPHVVCADLAAAGLTNLGHISRSATTELQLFVAAVSPRSLPKRRPDRPAALALAAGGGRQRIKHEARSGRYPSRRALGARGA
eukprot:SAG22_NODE_729_length_7596_cov_20.310924_5_plen_907_part_00